MTDKQILKAACKLILLKGKNEDWSYFHKWYRYFQNQSTHEIDKKRYYHFIFSHRFAEAFWGNKLITARRIYNPNVDFAEMDIDASEDIDKAIASEQHKELIQYYCNPTPEGKQFKVWEYHIQQMILEKNPLKYLERFL